MSRKTYRIGLGFDLHLFTRKRKGLILGGTAVPSSFGLKAVSDGDLILHAIADALCGAVGLGDIGDYFPPEAKKSKNTDSRKIIKFILKKIGKKFTIVNIDLVVVADRPPLKKHKKAILRSLRMIFPKASLNLKLKSKEGSAILGGRDSMSCFAIALLKK